MRITIDTEKKVLEISPPVTVQEVKEVIFDLATDWWMTYQILIGPEVPEEAYGTVPDPFDTPWPTDEPFFNDPNSQILDKI
jgi:hypothetical protein